MLHLKTVNSSPQIRKLLPLAVAAAVVIITCPWFLQPIHQTLKASSQKNHIDTLYAERLARLQSLVQKEKVQLKQLKAWEEENRHLLFDASEADSMSSNLDQKAASLNCQVVGVKYKIRDVSGQNPKDGSCPVHFQDAEIQIIGQYNCWVQFVGWLESLQQGILIPSLHLQSLKDRPGLLTGRIEISIPVQNDPSCGRCQRTAGGD